MSNREYIRLKTKLASALCQMLRYDEQEAEWVRIISHEEAKTISEDEVLARFDWHHSPIPKAHDGPDVHWNLTPVQKAEHRTITSKIDIPRIAKGKRIRRANDEHVNALLRKDKGEPKQSSRWPQGRKLQSRNSFQRAPT